MNYLDIKSKTYLVFGVANKKSVAYFIAKELIENGAKVVFSVQNDDAKTKLKKFFPDSEVFICNVEKEQEIIDLKESINPSIMFDGIVHSIAFANYSNGYAPFHETKKQDFLQALDISCFSLVKIANIFKNKINENGSVITISISATHMASENYGYMAPIKAALESSLCFLAKSFSKFSNIRFNAVSAGLLKTSASAGIPNYIDSYIYAEKATIRHQAIKTEEVANAAIFLLSPRSSGINAQKIIVDAGMGVNFFDESIIKNQS